MSLYLTSILGNSQSLDGGSMFGHIPRALWSNWISPDRNSLISLSSRSLLVEWKGINILCEVGIGSFFEPKKAKRFGIQNYGVHVLIRNLKRHGLNPEDIHYVILSHLHFDHCGGLLPTYQESLKGEEELKFPKATYLVTSQAYRRGLKPHLRDRASFIPDIAKRLKNSKRLKLIKKPKDVPKALEKILSFFVSYGHTPGQLHAVFKGKKGSIVFTGDLIPGKAWVHLPVTMGFDRFPEKIINEKQAFYKKIDLQDNKTKKGTWIFYTHDPLYACSQVKKESKDRFQPTQLKKSLKRFEI